MIIQYEPNDAVFLEDDYGGVRWTVVGLRKHGVVLQNASGERMFAGKHQIEPAPDTLSSATKRTEAPE